MGITFSSEPKQNSELNFNEQSNCLNVRGTDFTTGPTLWELSHNELSFQRLPKAPISVNKMTWNYVWFDKSMVW